MPNAKILLLIPPIPIKLKYLALILVGWATYVALHNGTNAGGQAAHLGGAAWVSCSFAIRSCSAHLRSGARPISAWASPIGPKT